jgi:hypothetical protein
VLPRQLSQPCPSRRVVCRCFGVPQHLYL